MENSYQNVYPWDHLKPENNDRSATLASIVGPYIKENENVFDVCCGYSPLSSFFFQNGCHVSGFDISHEVIQYCKESYPKGNYFVADDSVIEVPENIQVLVHLGIAPGEDPWGLESRNEINATMRVIQKNHPRIIIIETAKGYTKKFDILKRLVSHLGLYDLVKEAEYKIFEKTKSINPNSNIAADRTICVFQKNPEKEVKNSFCSLTNETLLRFFSHINTSAQAESFADLNIGFGFLYYAMGRIVRPHLAVVLGSKKGFSPISIALAIRDNANAGKLIFVDAGYDDEEDGKDKGYGGCAFWKNSEGVKDLLKQFNVSDTMEVKVMLTAEFVELHKKENLPLIDLLLIDADHSYKGFKHDFEAFQNLMSDTGLILAHDTEVKDGENEFNFGIKKYFKIKIFNNAKYQAISLPFWPGLGIVRKNKKIRFHGNSELSWRRVMSVILKYLLYFTPSFYEWIKMEAKKRFPR